MDIKKILMTLALVAFCVFPVLAQDEGVTSYNVEDDYQDLRIKYDGSETTATFSNGTATATLILGSTTYTYTFSGTNTVAGVKGWLDTKSNVRSEYVCGLAADAPDGDVIAMATLDLTDKEWHEVITVDTSAELQFSTCSYGTAGRSGTKGGARYLKWIYGNVVGTGDITVNVYIDGTEKFEKVIVSPGTVGANTTLNDVTGPGQLNIEIPGRGIYVGPSQRCLIRATMASTATTGSIGGLYDMR